jgi:hypothetical protein
MRDQITRIKITKKNTCFLENRRSCNEILAIFADCPFRFNGILSAGAGSSFSYMLPGSPNGRISNIGQAIFQDIKKFTPVPFMCGRNKL